jgi:hypothetical protein
LSIDPALMPPPIVARLTRQCGFQFTSRNRRSDHWNIAPQYRDLRERSVDLVLGKIIRPLAEHDLEAERRFDDYSVVAVGAKNRWLRRRKP